MDMARIPVAQLQVQSQGPGLVRANPTAAARNQAQPSQGGDLRQWVGRAPISSGALMTGGLGLAAIGAVGALVITTGFIGTTILGGMMTLGGGLAFLGALKRKDRRAAEQAPKALPPSSPATVIAERASRVRAVLDRGGDYTFERLGAELRWTENALLETLVAMKEAGQIVEDLNLDTGEWVYRSQVHEFGTHGAMTLADRQARQIRPEAHS